MGLALYSEYDLDVERHRFIKFVSETVKVGKDLPSISDYIESTRYLPVGSTPYPGAFSFKHFPYLKEILDSLHPKAPFREVALMKGTQVAYTVGILENWQAYVIAKDPAYFAYLNMDQEIAEQSMKTRLDAVITQSNLEHLIFSQNKRQHQRKTGDTNKLKEFPGGKIFALGVKSADKLRQESYKYIAADECETYPRTIGEDGSTVMHIRRRTDSYKDDYKILWGSTPLIKETSFIEPLYLQGDQRKYFIPCVHCGHHQFLKWSQIKFDVKQDGNLDVEYDPHTGRLTKSSVRYECESCGKGMVNSDKDKFMKLGKWQPTAVPIDPRFRSYHLPALYSPVGFRSWEAIAQEFCLVERNGGNKAERQNWINTALGETFSDLGEKPRIDQILLNERTYSINTLPANNQAVFSLLTADVQKDRIEAEVVAWARDAESYSINYYVFPGETDDLSSDCYTKLRELILSKPAGLPIVMAGVDSSYRPDTVIAFCESMGAGVYPLQGKENLGLDYFRLASISGSNLIRIQLNAYLLKDMMYRFLKSKKGETGHCNFPIEYERKHFLQLVAEDRKVDKKGKIIYDTGSRKNERLDIRYYHLGLLHVLKARYKDSYDVSDLTWDEFWELVYGNEL